jgi:hypothetical protein
MAPEQETELFSGARHATERQRGETLQQRIDRPHSVNNGHLQSPVRVPAGCSSCPPDQREVVELITEYVDSEPLQLLEPHAAELIDRLQGWQAELDAREAQLNARVALFELQERQFRLWEQQQRAQATEKIRSATAANEELKNALRRQLIAEMPASLGFR